MDRAAILIDAGHLLAEGGKLCCSTGNRTLLTCRHADLIAHIAARAEVHCNLPILRTYWYDGARNAIPSLDQLLVAGLPHVKLRLGRLSGGKQKGVDALIYRDLMTLARERAIATAYLLGGDEDLREGVVFAQDTGVRVVVIGVEPSGSQRNQAETLIREADEILMLSKQDLAPFFALTPTPAPAPVPAKGKTAVQAAASSAAQRGSTFAEQWTARASSPDLRELVSRMPRIPKELDGQLIRFAESDLGSLRERDDLKRSLRQGFWERIRKELLARDSGD